jgi:hypothetical protein
VVTGAATVAVFAFALIPLLHLSRPRGRPVHVASWCAAALALGVLLASAGLPMAVCMVVLMLAPLVTVIGTAGHGSQRLVTRQRPPCVWQPDAVEQPAGRRPRRRATPDARRGGPRRRHSRFQRGRDLSTATSGDGSKRCSTSQRTARKLRNDHHARITSRSTWVP